MLIYNEGLITLLQFEFSQYRDKNSNIYVEKIISCCNNYCRGLNNSSSLSAQSALRNKFKNTRNKDYLVSLKIPLQTWSKDVYTVHVESPRTRLKFLNSGII